MKYTEKYTYLKDLFSSEKREIAVPGSSMKIFNMDFESGSLPGDFINKMDYEITENRKFTYPVFKPSDETSKKVILLMHGLNERSWLKYLTWADYLSEETKSYVVLFPISFHVNRSPLVWQDPRKMIDIVRQRNRSLGNPGFSSYANVALSNRLTEDPLRFFKSGYQTTTDLIKLLSDIRQGKHELIPQCETINIFAYSIGAFLAQIFMMGNPSDLLTGSKLFIFCGGSVFSNMNGSSRLIMDKHAFDVVYDYYMNDFEDTLKGKNLLVDYLCSSRTGMAFRSMIAINRFRSFREKILNSLNGQLRAIILNNDSVIPVNGILQTIGNNSSHSKAVQVLDFPYAYSHENPFPVGGPEIASKVDLCFDRVFSEAANFLD